MKKGIIAVVIIALLGLGIGLLVRTPNTETEAQTNTATKEVVSQVTAQLRIDEIFYDVTLDEGASALDLMDSVAEAQEEFSFAGSASEFGFFVEEINGVANNSDTNEYWTLYVNDEMAQVGVSTYTLQQNDVISWEYEEVTF